MAAFLANTREVVEGSKKSIHDTDNQNSFTAWKNMRQKMWGGLFRFG